MKNKKGSAFLLDKNQWLALIIILIFLISLITFNILRTQNRQKNAGLLFTYAQEYKQTANPNRKAELEQLMLKHAERTVSKQAEADVIPGGIISTIDLILRCYDWVAETENFYFAPYVTVEEGMLYCMNNPIVTYRNVAE